MDPVFTAAAALASLLGKGIVDVINEMEETVADAKIKKETLKVASLRDIGSKSIESGKLDELLTKFYEKSENDFQLYESPISPGKKIAFAYKNNWLGLDIDLTAKAVSNFKFVRDNMRKEDLKLSIQNIWCRLKAYETLGIRVWNLPIYTIKSFEIENNKIQSELQLSKYFYHIFGKGIIQEEVFSALNENKGDIEKILNNRDLFLHARKSHLSVLNQFSRYDNKITPIGISALVAIERGDRFDDYALILQKRSQKVMEAPGALAVVPSAIHQPMVDSTKEANPISTIWREIYEELLGGEEATTSTQHLVHDWYTKSTEIMKQITNTRTTKVKLTACGFNLLTGFLELCALVVIGGGIWDEYWHSFKANWEISDENSPLISSKNHKELMRALEQNGFIAQSRVAFEQGIKQLKIIDSNRVDPDNKLELINSNSLS